MRSMVRNGARPETGAWTVGDAEIHRHADDGDLEVAEIGLVGIHRHIGRGQEGRHAGIRRKARAALGENLVRHLAEFRIEQLAAMAFAILGPQLASFFSFHAMSFPRMEPGACGIDDRKAFKRLECSPKTVRASTHWCRSACVHVPQAFAFVADIRNTISLENQLTLLCV